MSQEKVDRYKKDKANRQKIMKREKLVVRLEIAAVIVVLVGLISWFSFAVYQNVTASASADAETVTTSLDLTDIDAYMNELSSAAENTGTETESEDASSETAAQSDSTAASSESAETSSASAE